MDFDGLLGIIIFIAIVGFNIVVPVIKGLNETRKVEESHEKMRSRRAASQSRQASSGKPEGIPEAATRMSGHDVSRKSGRHGAPRMPEVLPPWDIPLGEFAPIPPRAEAPQARRPEKKQPPRESPQEMLERIMRENERKALSGEICDACYEDHAVQTKYAAMLRGNDTLVGAIVASEILGKPLALRGDGGAFDSKF